MGELELIRWIRTRGLPGARPGLVKVGPGDDCAVLAGQGAGWDLLLKTDGVVAGVHFERRTGAGRVGRKALARPLSDIAASGGEPLAAVVHVALEPRGAGRWARELQKGLARAAGLWRCPVVGGDMSGTPGPTTVAVAILGRHLSFTPRLAEGRWLSRFRGVGGVIDVSDGLTRDLAHVLAESGDLGAELAARAIPVSRAARRLGGYALEHALTDGEDYELLFTVRPARAAALRRLWPFRTRLTEIGEVRRRGAGLRLRTAAGWLCRLEPAGWEHLAGK
jgi:thiamine-monophosphate kinase